MPKSESTRKAVRPVYGEELYVRRGRRYVCCSDPYAVAGLMTGFWLVHVREGGTTIRKPVYPDRLALSAAIEEARDALVTALSDAIQLRPSRKPTPAERKAWAAYCAEAEKRSGTLGPLTWWQRCCDDIVNAALKVLKTR